MEDLGRLDLPAFKAATKLPVVVVLDNVRSAHNIGSIFRTCDAFRVEALYLTGICATPPHKEIMKTALGAADSVTWAYFSSTVEAIQALKEAHFQIVAVEQTSNSTSLEKYPTRQKTAFIFGNEVNGVDAEALALCETCVEIPQFGTKHSFNVSITAGIILWDTFLKLQITPQ